jgi:molecular chaperone Hsp33
VVGTNGDLAVTRLLENAEPFTGSVELVSGEIAEDVATYLARSEQIPSATLLGVLMGSMGVTHAGGVIVQAMPGVDDQTLRQLEENVRQLGQFTTVLRTEGLLGVVDRLMHRLAYQPSADTALPLHFRCRCSMDRALRALTYFSKDEHLEMIETGGQEVVCHWCNERYQVPPELIATLFSERMNA